MAKRNQYSFSKRQREIKKKKKAEEKRLKKLAKNAPPEEEELLPGDEGYEEALAEAQEQQEKEGDEKLD